jgi:hypothetical protein
VVKTLSWMTFGVLTVGGATVVNVWGAPAGQAGFRPDSGGAASPAAVQLDVGQAPVVVAAAEAPESPSPAGLVVAEPVAGDSASATVTVPAASVAPLAIPVITTPANGSTITNSWVTLVGRLTPPADNRKVIAQDKDDATNQCAAVVRSDGSWTCDLPKALAKGAHSVTAYAQDPATNTNSSATGVSFVVGVGISLPNPSQVVVDTEPGTQIQVYAGQIVGGQIERSASGQALCTTTADDSGHAVCQLALGQTLQPGAPIVIDATDQAGNLSSLSLRVLRLTVSPPAVELPGQSSISLLGDYFWPGEQVEALIDGVVDLGSAKADAQGSVRFTWDDLGVSAVGSHTVLLRGDQSGLVGAGFSVEQVAPTDPPTASPTPTATASPTPTATASPTVAITPVPRSADPSPSPSPRPTSASSLPNFPGLSSMGSPVTPAWLIVVGAVLLGGFGLMVAAWRRRQNDAQARV